MALAALAVLTGCAAGQAHVAIAEARSAAHGPRSHAPRRPVEMAAEEDRRQSPVAEVEVAPMQGHASGRHRADSEAEEDLRAEWEKGWAGWRDGVGPGRPYAVPMAVDYFQGTLLMAGVPEEALPQEGQAVAPEEAMRLLPHVVEPEATLADFGPKRLAVHLLLEVWRGGVPVRRQELHARLERYLGLLVLRPDGYLVRPYSGRAVQRVGAVRWAEDGTLRAGSLEVGPFYTVARGWLYPVDERLEVQPGTRAAGRYAPDDGLVGPALEGAALAVVDAMEGLVQLASHPLETAEGLTRLPGAVGALVRGAPEHWKAYRDKPPGERVRLASRLMTSAVLLVGTSGAGAARAAAAGGSLGRLALPTLKLLPDGRLALSVAAVVPAGQALAVAAPGVAASYVLHMAQVGAKAAGGGPGKGWKPPVGGPGQWVRGNEFMSPRARCYQCQVSGAPEGWVYRVWRSGEKVDFDGFMEGCLLDAKGLGYDKFFGKDLDPKPFFQGAREIVARAEKQLRIANGVPIRWYVAEERMVDILRKLFAENGIRGIEVIHKSFRR